jgi:hypothetical protein
MQVPKSRNNKKYMFLVVMVIVIVVMGAATGYTKYEKPLFENEDGNVIIKLQKNNNQYIDSLEIGTRHIKKFIQLGKSKDPDTEAFDDLIDDYRIELFKNEINNGEKLNGVSIYLEGIPNMAGYSSIYGRYFKIDNSIFLYTISFDHEYFDRSGIEFQSFVLWTDSDKSLSISKYRYSDTNEIYYEIDWDEDINKKGKLELLTSFFNKLRYANVYNDPKFDKKWFAEIYTDIEEYQQIEDLFEVKQ